MSERPHHRPMLPGAAHFEAITDDVDPAARTEAADRCATLLVRGAREFDAGRTHTPVQEVVAGVVDPPGPDEVRLLTDQVLRGIVQGDFADTLFRAAAFARVVATGRAHVGASHALTPHDSDLSASRLLTMAEQLEHAGRLEIDGLLA